MYLDVDGQPAFVYTGGRPARDAEHAAVWLHGAGFDHSVWLWQSRYFAQHGLPAVAVDLPGHGRSGGAPLTSIAAMAHWTGALVRTLGIGRVALVGHSMGALIALAAAARAPIPVSALAIIGAAVPMPVSDALLGATAANEYAAIDMITTWAHSTSALLGGYAVPGIWQTGNARRLLERAAPGVLHSDFHACHTYLDGLTDAVAVRCPALVVCGGRDLMTPPRAAQPLISTLPECRAVTIPGAGHMVMTEQPDAVLDALRAFLRPVVAGAGW